MVGGGDISFSLKNISSFASFSFPEHTSATVRNIVLIPGRMIE